HRLLVDAGLAVDAQADRHRPVGHVEQGVLGAGQGAAVEGDAERAGGVVGLPGDALGGIEVGARLDRGPGDLEHGEVTGDAAAVAVVPRLPRGDVVADRDDAHVVALAPRLSAAAPKWSTSPA